MGVKLYTDEAGAISPVPASLSDAITAAAGSAAAADADRIQCDADVVATADNRVASANSANLAASVALGSSYTKVPVRAASTSNLTLSGEGTYGGVACVAGDRVLAAGQTAGAQKGVYVVATGAWARAGDMDTAGKVTGAEVLVQGGTHKGKIFRCVTESIVLGTTPLEFHQGGDAIVGVVSPPGAEAVGPVPFGAYGIPVPQDSNKWYGTGVAAGYGKFCYGFDADGAPLFRALKTLSHTIDGTSIPGFPYDSDFPPSPIIPQNLVIAADATFGGIPTLAFINLTAPKNNRHWFVSQINTGQLSIATNADAWTHVGNAPSSAPISAMAFQRDRWIPTQVQIYTSIQVGNSAARGFFLGSGVNPAPGSTITLNGTVVTFVAAGPVGNQVLIGADYRATFANLITYLRASADAEISVCRYDADGNSDFAVIYKTKVSAGNSFAIAASVDSGFTTSGATLSGFSTTAINTDGDVVTSANITAVSGTFSNGLSVLAGSVNFPTLALAHASLPFLQLRNTGNATDKQYYRTYMATTTGDINWQFGGTGAAWNTPFMVAKNAGGGLASEVAFGAPFTSKGYTVAQLTALTGMSEGARAHVTDGASAPAFMGAIPAGGGSAKFPVIYLGGAWLAG